MDLLQFNSKNVLKLVEFKKTFHSNNTISEQSKEVLPPDSSATVQAIKQSQRYLSQNEIKEIVQEYMNGATTDELARKYNCHRVTIRNNLKRQGIDLSCRAEGRKYKAEDVIRLYTIEKKTVKQIARIYDVSDSAIYKCLKRNNINTKRTRWNYEES